MIFNVAVRELPRVGFGTDIPMRRKIRHLLFVAVAVTLGALYVGAAFAAVQGLGAFG
jgi:hypothetical protein